MNAPWRLRGYSIERLLGVGASSEVWRARVGGTGGAVVALKRIRVDDAEQARRAQTEAALLTALDHPHLVRLHALVPRDDAAVLVLDLAEGGSLAQLLAARQRLTPGEVITAVAPIAAALAYLHDEGVVHGDVSAANILFTADGVPLLADVGMARLTGEDRAVCSTPAYVDPSVAAGCVPGPRSDVFMLGAVALHALTGAPAWPAASADDALAAAAAGRLGDLAERLREAGVPEEMARVVRRALELDPHRRGTAADLALDLRHSGEPLAVELGAGRERVRPTVSGPRHAAPPGGARESDPVADGSGRGTSGGGSLGRNPDAARPEFDRPSGVPGGVGSAPPTRMVRARPRPVIPRPTPRRGRRRTLMLVLAGVAALLLGTAGTVWASTDAGSSHARPAVHAAAGPARPVRTTPTGTPTGAPTGTPTGTPTGSSTVSPATVPAEPTSGGRPPPIGRPSGSPRPTTSHPTTSRPTTSRSTPSRSTTAGPAWPASRSAATWRRVLDELDAVRATAFATRDDAVLAHVYASELLLRTDTELLHRIVAPGCGLIGARTAYSNLHVVPTGDTAVITATAVLAPSRLRCAGRDRGAAAGLGPVRLRIELVRSGQEARIGDQQRV